MATSGVTRSSLRRAAIATCVLGLAASACGNDADTPDDAGAEPQLPNVAIEAVGGRDDLTFRAPQEVAAGAAEITFTNSSELREVDAQLLFVSEPRSDTDVSSEFAAVTVGAPVAEWFEAGGGVGPTLKGETATVTQELREGTYFVVGGPGPVAPPLTKITVTAGEHATGLPETEAVVEASDYGFEASGLEAGTTPVRLENTGRQWHQFLASRMVDDVTIEDAELYLKARIGRSPFVGSDGADSAVLEGGTSQVVELELRPGRYAFFCYMADKRGGDPHVAKGMASEITVPG